MEERLYNVRDLHWKSPNNVRNSGNTPSSKTTFVGYDTSVATTGVTYRENRIVFSGSDPGLRYYFRPTSDFLAPTHVKIKMHASNIDAKLYVDDLEIGDIGSFSNLQEVKEKTIALGQEDRERILLNRMVPRYENYSIECVGTPNLVGSSNPVAVYGFEMSLIGNETYENFISNNPYSSIRLLPTGVRTSNVHWKNHDNASLNFERFNSSPTGVGVNSTFIQSQNEPGLHNTLPSGYLSVLFSTNTTETVNVNRARLSFNMSLPVSGSRGNYRDKIDIYGKSNSYNYGFNSLINNEWLDVLDAELGSEESEPPSPTGIHPHYNVLWGYSDIIENSGFLNYNVDLCFLDPEKTLTPSNSGNASSRKFSNLAAFKDLELKFVGVPSGAQLSAMELILETLDDNNIDLFVFGSYKEDNNISVFIDGSVGSTSSFTDLVMPNNHKTINTNPQEFSEDEYFAVWMLEDNNPNLYIYGRDFTSSTSTLFIKTPEPINSNFNLYTKSAYFFNTFFPCGAIFSRYEGEIRDRFGEIIEGRDSCDEQNLSLHIIGTPETASFNLFVRGLDPNDISSSLTLSIRSSAQPSIFSTSNLFVQALNYNPDSYLPLYINNSLTEQTINSMNLFIGNDIRKSDSVQLFLSNNNAEINSFKKLFLKTSNYYRYNSNMNLYIARDFEGLSSSCTMFLKTVDGEFSSVPMFTQSSYISNTYLDYFVEDYMGAWMLDPSDSYLDLTITGSDIKPNSSSDLFISGF